MKRDFLAILNVFKALNRFFIILCQAVFANLTQRILKHVWDFCRHSSSLPTVRTSLFQTFVLQKHSAVDIIIKIKKRGNVIYAVVSRYEY